MRKNQSYTHRTMASLQCWDILPVELQQNILLRVHWHDLCRCRAVCKKWNHVISKPIFATLHAMTLRPECCVLTAPRKVMTSSDIDPTVVVNENDEWQLLDIPANRMFSIPDPIIRTLRERLLRASQVIHVSVNTIAASGGFIYALYRARRNFRIFQLIIVCNPVTKGFHRIPARPPGYYLDPVAMVVEVVESTLRYRIIQPRGVWNAYLRAVSGPWDFVLYDSRARVWRNLCHAPSAAHFPCSCVVLNDIFYVMFNDTPNRRHELYSCDLETGEWCLIDVSLPRPPHLPQVMKSCTQVVAASGCLFFVGYSGPARWANEAVITVTIWRITLGERPKLTLEAKLPSFKSGFRLHRKGVVVATGCGDSVVVSTFQGRRVRWDVVRRTWYRLLPPFLPTTDDAACYSFFAGNMDLETHQLPP